MNTEQRTIDLSKANGYVITDADLIIRRLKKDKLYKPDLFYRGFNGEKFETMLEHGTDNPHFDTIFVTDENGLREGETSIENPIFYAFSHPVPALAVYGSSKLKEERMSVEGLILPTGRLEFIDSKNKLEALVAVYYLIKE